MLSTDKRYRNYVQIIQEELVPAMGCTEPIAIAYGAAKARAILGKLPDSALIEASGNIIKNVKSVVVPNTNGLKGIAAAAAAGIIAGNEDKVLEVISDVPSKKKEEITNYLTTHNICVIPDTSGAIFAITLSLFSGTDTVKLKITDYHTNIVFIEHNGIILLENGNVLNKSTNTSLTDRSCLSVEGIFDFATTCLFSDIEAIIEQQISCNYAIAKEGIKSTWGANIGKVIQTSYSNDIAQRARAMAAAASDARMSGCELPVIIVSGSGNQGIAASVPVIEYAKHLKVSHETMVRAVLLSDLLTIHLKTGIGRLSAYCGATSAGCAAGAAIAFLFGGGEYEVSHTLVNSLAIISGMVCDGAKPSCAAKISAAIDAGILGYNMIRCGQQFYGGDGIVSKGVENTIVNIGRLGNSGMRETDHEILRIMTAD